MSTDLTLRQRIEQRITDLRVERGIAAAATPGPWTASDFGHPGDQEPTSRVIHQPPFVWRDLRDGEGAIAWCSGDNDFDDATHIATQDPATTIARIDRELAGCAADLVLLGLAHLPQGEYPTNESSDQWARIALANLEARYPKEDA